MSETAIFTHETDPFTMNPVALLKLSKEAYYLYGYIKSKPSGWLFHKERTLKDVSLSKYGFYKALRDLEAAGYMTRTQVKKNGKFSSVIYQLHSTATPKKVAVCGSHRVSISRPRKNDPVKYIDSKLYKEKIKNKKETSLRDNTSNPYGVSTEKEIIMDLKEQLAKAKDKNEKALQKKKEKQDEKDKNPFRKEATKVAGGMYTYFLSILSPKQRELTERCLDTHKDNTAIYRFVNCCKAMDFDVYTQKRILDYCVSNWDTIVKVMKCFTSFKAIPNIPQIADFFFMIGFLCDAYGLGINPDSFRAKSNGEFNTSVLDFC